MAAVFALSKFCDHLHHQEIKHTHIHTGYDKCISLCHCFCKQKLHNCKPILCNHSTKTFQSAFRKPIFMYPFNKRSHNYMYHPSLQVPGDIEQEEQVPALNKLTIQTKRYKKRHHIPCQWRKVQRRKETQRRSS